ncbi:SET domain-containing protein [Hypoxylon sp. NC0597]|nr:SET domain-containing protein [Hypoxylon sp. NC0597]
MPTQSTIDTVEEATYKVQAATTGDGVPVVSSSNSVLESEHPSSGNGDGHDTIPQSSEVLEQLGIPHELVEWNMEEPSGNQSEPTMDATPVEGADKKLEPADNDSGRSTTPASAGSQSPCSLGLGGSEQGESCSPNSSYEVDNQTTTSTDLSDKACAPESLPYGEIAFKDLANPEQFSNEFFEIKKSQLGGNGVFAKVDLKRGQVILAERPTISASSMNLYRELDKLAPELQQAFYRLHCHRRTSDQDERHAIFMTNAFAIDELSCVYMIGSRFNHACPPLNSVGNHVVDHRVMEFRMKRDVPAGTELTIAYGRLSPWHLYRMWGFRCACGGCTPITDEEVAQVDSTSDAEGVW